MTNSSDDSGLLSLLITGGLGATLGSVFTAVLQAISKRGEVRAQAADLITGAATEMIDRIRAENKSIREAFTILDDVVHELILREDLHPEVRETLRGAAVKARRAL